MMMRIDERKGIGFVAVFTGLIGTSGGGLLVDRLGGTDSVATMICLIFSILILPISVLAFSISNEYLFFILVTVGELLIFGITSPINILCLRFDRCCDLLYLQLLI